MTTVVVDASVWVSAADASDEFCLLSRDFLTIVAERTVAIAVPDIAQAEVACALARRLGNAKAGRELTANALHSLAVDVHATDRHLVDRAVIIGTDSFLRGCDAIYAALAERLDGRVISWDDELIQRADAVTPETWLEVNRQP